MVLRIYSAASTLLTCIVRLLLLLLLLQDFYYAFPFAIQHSTQKLCSFLFVCSASNGVFFTQLSVLFKCHIHLDIWLFRGIKLFHFLLFYLFVTCTNIQKETKILSLGDELQFLYPTLPCCVGFSVFDLSVFIWGSSVDVWCTWAHSLRFFNKSPTANFT